MIGVYIGPQTIAQIHLRMNDDTHFTNVDEWQYISLALNNRTVDLIIRDRADVIDLLVAVGQLSTHKHCMKVTNRSIISLMLIKTKLKRLAKD